MTNLWVEFLIFGSAWVSGALINYLADILPSQPYRLSRACPVCGARQRFSNYLPWPGRCWECRTKPGMRYWLIQMITPLAVGTIWLRPPPGIGFFGGLLLWLYCSLVVVMDIEHHLILRLTNLFGILLGLVVGWSRQGLVPTLAGAISGFILLLIVYGLGFFLGHLNKRWQNMTIFGLGDVFFGCGLGMIAGWPDIWISLLIALAAAGLTGMLLLVIRLAQHRYTTETALPLAPFLVFGLISILYS